ncbi:glycoside hydrolase family 28 protein [Reichenbachiella versicolor]|uniref:glycoside hydrolase family 28 protein n=1 Tax=Reichenbachiella versicolor TaxID=1821036 RepID=UPI000D6E4A3D|nr:glycosyl hydrolase family 28 protein [Reichenbachiella versicolor]
MTKNLVTALCIFMALWSCDSKTEWNITEFGATTDSSTVNTQAIQAAIDACYNSGGGRVIIDGGTYVSGTILLKDNVDLHIAEGSTLLGSPNPYDYQAIDPFIDATGQTRGKCLVGAIDVQNVSITGKGTIDGQGQMFRKVFVKRTLHRLGIRPKPEIEAEKTNQDKKYLGGKVGKFDRPFLLRFVRTKGITLQDIFLTQPAAWTVHFFQCSHFLVDGISIYSHANRNNDAIDIDSSTDGIIRNSNLDSGDDAICFKSTSPKPSERVKVYNCKLSSHWGAIKFGTESMGDYRDIEIKNCFIHDTKGGGIKILSVDGSNIDNVLIDSITMENVEMPLFMRLGERRLTYRDAEQQPVGSINNVRICNVKATTRSIEESRVTPPAGVFITGTPHHAIGNIELENISIDLPGGGTAEMSTREMPENEAQYPEFTKFDGPLPAYGLFARHVKDLKMKNVVFNLFAVDEREEVIIQE